MERAVLLSKGAKIGIDDLPQTLVMQSRVAGGTGFKQMGLKDVLAEPEKAAILAALDTNNWNRQNTAKALQINRTTLYKKMKRYGLEDEAARLGL
jgi:transcriptional regulator of acetoin/glycerol metabolism